MSIEKIRSVHTVGYGQLDMRTIRNPDLSNAELGLLLRIISFSEDWRFSLNGMVGAYPKDKVTSVKSSLKGLIEKGYIVTRGQMKDDKGKFAETHMLVYELPQKPNTENLCAEKPCAVNLSTENPCAGNPCAGNPCTENPCAEEL